MVPGTENCGHNAEMGEVRLDLPSYVGQLVAYFRLGLTTQLFQEISSNSIK